MKKTQPPVEAAAVETAKPVEAPTEPVFTIDQLRLSARALFDVSQSTYDGATASLDSEQMFTVEQMREHIDHWLKEEY